MSTVDGQGAPGGSSSREPANLKLEAVAHAGTDGAAMTVEDHRR
jgi:hypothetical protein